MKIHQRLSQPEPTFSFEFFPPRDEPGMRELFETIRQLEEFGPDYVSVTYGAGGSTRRLTIQLVCQIREEQALLADPDDGRAGRHLIDAVPAIGHRWLHPLPNPLSIGG